MITLKEELGRIIIVIMEKTSVDTNDVSEDMDVAAMDKECSALSALFQQIINEMKVCHIIFFISEYSDMKEKYQSLVIICCKISVFDGLEI